MVGKGAIAAVFSIMTILSCAARAQGLHTTHATQH